jgi:hypothetical protein
MADDNMTATDIEREETIGRVAFEISSELRQQAEAIVHNIRSDPDRQRHVPVLVDVVLAMTNRGLHYYFLHPLEEAGVGAVTRRAVALAIGTAGRTLPVVVRKTVKSLSDEQLLSLADFIDHILIREAEEATREP